MKKLISILIIYCITIISCAEHVNGVGAGNDTVSTNDIGLNEDLMEEGDDDTAEWVPWVEEDVSRPLEECIECKWYFCPPLDAVWQKEIC